MVLFENAIQPIQREVRIHLRRRDISMTQNRLHGAQIGAVLHHVGCATVPQHVRAGMASRLRRGRVNQLPHALTRDAFGSSGDEEYRR